MAPMKAMKAMAKAKPKAKAKAKSKLSKITASGGTQMSLDEKIALMREKQDSFF